MSRYNVVIEAELRRVGIDIPTWRVLMILGEHEPQPIAQVAKSAVINLSTMARIVVRMVKRDLVGTVPSASDGRVTELVLSSRGREKLVAAREVTAPVYQRVISGFSATDFGRLINSLNRLQANLL